MTAKSKGYPLKPSKNYFQERTKWYNPRYVVLKGGTYYFRLSLSPTLRRALRKREIQRSLKTSDPTIAGHIAETLVKRAKLFFAELMNTQVKHIAHSELEQMVATWFTHQVEKLRVEVARGGISGDNSWNENYEIGFDVEIENIDHEIRQIERRLLTSVYRPKDNEEVANTFRVSSLNDEEFALLRREFFRLKAKFLEFKAHLYARNWDITDQLYHSSTFENARRLASKNMDRASENSLSKTELKNGHSIEQLRKEYVKYHEIKGTKPKTIRAYEAVIDRLGLILPNRTVESITRDDAKEVIHTLKKIPKRQGRVEKLTLEDVKRAKQLTIPVATEIGNTYSAGQLHTLATRLASLFNFAQNELEWISKNPFKGITKLAGSKSSHKKRKRLTNEDLQNLFHPEDFLKAAKRSKFAARYWLPLLALHTGARPEELAQLRVKDIIMVDGIHCINIVDEQNQLAVKTSVKNTNAIRQVPIHNKLIKLGFLDFHRSRNTKAKTYLFYELNSNSDGKRFPIIGKWWNDRYRKDRLENFEEKPFYAFRKTFITSLRNSGVDKGLFQHIVGHEPDDVTAVHYLEDPPIEMLEVAVNKAVFQLHYEKLKLNW